MENWLEKKLEQALTIALAFVGNLKCKKEG